MTTVLFVCTGNITRSMTAHYLFKDMLDQKKNNKFTVVSAGVKPAYSMETFKTLVDLFGERGVDVTHHKVQPVSQELVDNADYVICMAHHHRKALREQFGVDSYLFNELARVSSEDVLDEAEAKVPQNEVDDYLKDLFSYIERYTPVIYEKLVVLNEAK